MAEQLKAWPPKRAEEQFDGVGGKHSAWLTLGDSGIARVLGRGVEVDQVPARAVHEKTQQLFKNLGDRLPLAAATHGAKESIDLLKNLDVAKMANKQTQITAACERIVGHLNAVNRCFAFCRGFGTCHCDAPTFWDTVARYGMRQITLPYQVVSPLGGIFFRLKVLVYG
ncbi:hypothetical protein [Desulfosoma caldarium]|uniref:hypothetical protein n=1 Tax=Desulfosoma caldarium TaxID=610254 RepID=UPI0011CE3411|nr:hypothetical protein [Desulfosoma caldarium]